MTNQCIPKSQRNSCAIVSKQQHSCHTMHLCTYCAACSNTVVTFNRHEQICTVLDSDRSSSNTSTAVPTCQFVAVILDTNSTLNSHNPHTTPCVPSLGCRSCQHSAALIHPAVAPCTACTTAAAAAALQLTMQQLLPCRSPSNNTYIRNQMQLAAAAAAAHSHMACKLHTSAAPALLQLPPQQPPNQAAAQATLHCC
jgi:hypothetical protein